MTEMATLPAPPTKYVYAALDATHDVVYVGTTGNVDRRVAHHRTQAPWWTDELRFIVLAKVHHGAHTIEIAAIKKYQPKYNVVGNPLRYGRGRAA